MSLDKYTQARLVVQRPDTSAYDAIRAMEDNHIGAVIVYGEDEVLGIVTDRDLAVRVLGEDLEPREIPLEDVMSSPVSVLPPTATEADAARLMLENHVRRIPLVDGARLVGLVTLDDLASEQAIDAPTLAAIVRAQLSDRARHKRAGTIRPTQEGHVVDSTQTSGGQRHAARAAMSYHRLLGLVEAATRLNVRRELEVALDEVLGGLIRRVQPAEARHLVAQLPSRVRERLASLPQGPDRTVTRASIEAAVARRLVVDAVRARELVGQVGAALEQMIGSGEVEDVRGQLPREMRDIFPPQAPT